MSTEVGSKVFVNYGLVEPTELVEGTVVRMYEDEYNSCDIEIERDGQIELLEKVSQSDGSYPDTWFAKPKE